VEREPRQPEKSSVRDVPRCVDFKLRLAPSGVGRTQSDIARNQAVPFQRGGIARAGVPAVVQRLPVARIDDHVEPLEHLAGKKIVRTLNGDANGIQSDHANGDSHQPTEPAPDDVCHRSPTRNIAAGSAGPKPAQTATIDAGSADNRSPTTSDAKPGMAGISRDLPQAPDESGPRRDSQCCTHLQHQDRERAGGAGRAGRAGGAGGAGGAGQAAPPAPPILASRLLPIAPDLPDLPYPP